MVLENNRHKSDGWPCLRPPVNQKEKGDVFVLLGKDASGTIWRQKECTIQRLEWFLLREIRCKYFKKPPIMSKKC